MRKRGKKSGRFMGFNERDVKRIKNFIVQSVPKAISLTVWSVPYQGAGERAREQFGIMCRDEGEGLAADFMEVG